MDPWQRQRPMYRRTGDRFMRELNTVDGNVVQISPIRNITDERGPTTSTPNAAGKRRNQMSEQQLQELAPIMKKIRTNVVNQAHINRPNQRLPDITSKEYHHRRITFNRPPRLTSWDYEFIGNVAPHPYYHLGLREDEIPRDERLIKFIDEPLLPMFIKMEQLDELNVYYIKRPLVLFNEYDMKRRQETQSYIGECFIRANEFYIKWEKEFDQMYITTRQLQLHTNPTPMMMRTVESQLQHVQNIQIERERILQHHNEKLKSFQNYIFWCIEKFDYNLLAFSQFWLCDLGRAISQIEMNPLTQFAYYENYLNALQHVSINYYYLKKLPKFEFVTLYHLHFTIIQVFLCVTMHDLPVYLLKDFIFDMIFPYENYYALTSQTRIQYEEEIYQLYYSTRKTILSHYNSYNGAHQWQDIILFPKRYSIMTRFKDAVKNSEIYKFVFPEY